MDEVECVSSMLPFICDQVGLFDSKPRSGNKLDPIPVTIMDCLRQNNGGDCGMFTITYAHCLMEGKALENWATQERLSFYRESLTCHLWYHALWKEKEHCESDMEQDDAWDA
ncbi:hypothetical protein L484_003799 [Morus notabilis]|uniref:Ubiquitin-like protease family profile domain-containing protein n=1 Tax=Morus notabilis TaxID=981085 RepID=W9RDD0_9ROSA|nr:hypothetical protein L484_003799 [Morus notabilis]